MKMKIALAMMFASLSAAMAQTPSKWVREPEGFKDLKFGDSMKVAESKSVSKKPSFEPVCGFALPSA